MTFHLKDLAGLVMDEDDSKPQAAVQVVTVPPTVKTNVGVLQPSSITGTVDADHQDDVYQRLAAKTDWKATVPFIAIQKHLEPMNGMGFTYLTPLRSKNEVIHDPV